VLVSLAVVAAVAGCGGEEEPTAATESVTSETDGSATSAADLPPWEGIDGLEVPRDDFGTAVVGEEVWALGGMTGGRGNRLLSIEVLDTATETWRTSEIEMPVGLASFRSVAVGPLVYSFGGILAGGEASDFTGVLDTRTGTWRRLPPMPHPRYALSATPWEGRVYVVGGRSGDSPVPEVDVFDLEDETWTTLPEPMPAPRDSHDAVAVDDGIVVVAGWMEHQPTDRVDLFDPDTGTWTEQPSLPSRMSRAGVALVDGEVWAAWHEFSYVLDPEAGEWREGNALPLARHGFGLVQVGDAVYAIGGCALDPLRDVRTVDRVRLG
jgi:outer membrane protein assembly factor BamB